MTRTGIVVGVTLLVVVDVVLAVLAWNHVHSDDVGAGLVEEITDSATAATTPAPDPGASDPAAAEPSTYDAAVVADEVVARVGVRSCDAGGGRATVELSQDGGASFTSVGLPLAAVRHVRMPSSSEVVAVGADRNCEPAARVSRDGGESWKATSVESAGWSLAGEGRLFSPAGELRAVSCTPVAISGPTEEDAVVLCDDGSLLRTENAGSFWAVQAMLPAATDVAFVSAAEGYALVSRGDCGALVRATTDGGVTWRDATCLDAEPPAAVAADGDVVVVVTADTVYRSGDRGDNWEVY